MSKGLDILEGLASASSIAPGVVVPSPLPDETTPNFHEYNTIVLFTSGGKDSLACLLHLLDLGVSRDKIELHHHNVDGAASEATFMDWPCTHSYMAAFAKAFGMKLFFSYREGGFRREMLRENCGTAPITFTRGDGTAVTMGGERSKASTRRKFPQVSASLTTRWCSSSLKVEIGARLLNNDPRFNEGKTLVITGERAEESANRARYARFEPHRCDNRNGRIPRWIDHWRPVHSWTEAQVWDIIRRHKVNCHPAYQIGQAIARASCAFCIFGSKNQWATLREIAPDGFQVIADYEKEFGVTIHRKLSVVEQADRGTSCKPDPFWVQVAMSREYTLPIFVDHWTLPPGAFGEGGGPT
jgi:3'-phosphoadenosine 5'-phosphosulfate sulfotransferase (PAPS reductase)/FAD synthetase